MGVKIVGIAPNLLKSCNSHSHDEWEIVLSLSGSGKTFINDKEYDFYPGMINCIPKNFVHSKYSSDSFMDIYIQVDNFPAFNEKEPLVFFDDEEKSIETLMYMALRIFHKQEKNYEQIVDSISGSIISILAAQSGEKQKNESIELFKNEIIKNFTNPEFKISDAMSLINYCPDHFRRCFKNDTGITPVAYLNNLRIEFARNLLTKRHMTKMNIADVAMNSGFYDPHYFSRMFKKTVGVVPLDYVKQLKG